MLYRGMEKSKVLGKCQLDTKHTVFEGEYIGQVLGFELIRRELRERRVIRTVTMGMDGQPSGN